MGKCPMKKYWKSNLGVFVPYFEKINHVTEYRLYQGHIYVLGYIDLYDISGHLSVFSNDILSIDYIDCVCIMMSTKS
jgi:hypothetical protein